MKPLSFLATVVLPLLALCTYIGLIFAVGWKLLLATLVGLALGHTAYSLVLYWKEYKEFLESWDNYTEGED